MKDETKPQAHRPIHRTTWEDGQMAGVECGGRDVGTIIAGGVDPEPWVCDKCGAVLKLIWDVRLEEVTP